MAALLSRLLCAAAAGCVLAGPAAAQNGIRLYPLPDAAAYPEGVAAHPNGKTVYTSNIATGAIFAVDLVSGAVTLVGNPFGLAPGQESRLPARSVGAKIDPRGRMWVAGGETGTMHLYDLAAKKTLATFTTPAGNTFINDVVLTRDAAYFTDTRRPLLWRVPTNATADMALEPWISFNGTALEYTPGNNLNGIAATADGRYLIVVQMAAGRLFRIDTRTKEVTRIDAGTEDLTLGDGLILKGQRLYLVRQGAVELVALDLSPDLLTARVVKRIKPKEIAWPATMALVGDRLIIANSQLNTRGSYTPVRPFSLASVPLSAFE